MGKTIESEILDVYNAERRKRGEDDQAYWARLVQTSVEGDDEQWKLLDAPAQEWINSGVLAKKKGTDYLPFPDAPPPPVAEPEPDRFRVREVKARPVSAEPEPTPAPAPERRRRTRAPRPAPAPAPVAAAPAAAPPPAAKATTRRRGGNGKKPGVYRQTQEYVVKHPNASTQDIMAALARKGLDPQQHTVQSVRGHTRDTLKLVQTIKGVDMGIEL